MSDRFDEIGELLQVERFINYCRHHLFWFPFFGFFFQMKSCTDPLNLNISR